MKINIVLPGVALKPIGGYKVIYQYANYFADENNEVVVYLSATNDFQLHNNQVTKIVKSMILYLFVKFIFGIKPKWISINHHVKFKFKFNMNAHKIDIGDIIIATSVETAEFVSNSQHGGNKIYFIQGFEDFIANEKELVATYHLPMTKIVVASWLQKKLLEYGENSIVINNFLNHEEFYVTKEISERRPVVSMLLHRDYVKGSDIGLEVCLRVKKIMPQTEFVFFGTQDRPKNISFNFSYFKSATSKLLRESVYNQSQVFLVTSRKEGWGLTTTEAMACGDIVVSTDNGGIDDFGENMINLLINDVDDVDGLAENVVKVLQNSDLRKDISKRAVNSSLNLDIKNSGNKFLNILEGFTLS